MTHTSALITVNVECSNEYTIYASFNPNIQDVTFGETTIGYRLPDYTSSQQTGCPVNLIQVSTSNIAVI